MSVPTRTSRTRRAVATVAAAAVLPLGLTACGDGAGEKAAEKAAEKAIEDANGGDVDVDIDSGNVTVEGSDGAVQYGSDLPDDFPQDDVPLVGEVTVGSSSTTSGAKGWTVATTTDASPDDAFAEAKAALEDAGFAVDGIESGNYAQLKSDAYRLVLTASEASDGAQISYIISAAG